MVGVSVGIRPPSWARNPQSWLSQWLQQVRAGSCAPVAPGSSVGPVAPAAPAGPVGRVAPAAPAGPGRFSCTSYSR